MLKVLFFAQIKEVLKEEQILVEPVPANVAELRQVLQKRGETWNEFLQTNKALVAVNHTLTDDSMALNDNDEVAFFPPVTGG